MEARSVKGVELKGKAPVNPQTLRVRLPKPQEATLENGLAVACSRITSCRRSMCS